MFRINILFVLTMFLSACGAKATPTRETATETTSPTTTSTASPTHKTTPTVLFPTVTPTGTMEPIVELIETKTFVFEGGESIEMQSFTDSELGLEYVYEDETAPDDPTIFNNSNFSPEEAELIARLFTLPNFGEKGTGTVITWVSEYNTRVMVYSSGDGGWVIGYMRQDGTFATIYVDKLVGPLAKRLGVTE